MGSLSSLRAAGDWWDGFERSGFKVDERRCELFKPKEAAPGNPWIWRLRFLGHAPQVDLALFNKGFHVAWIDVSDMFGAPAALDHMDKYLKDNRLYLCVDHLPADRRLTLPDLTTRITKAWMLADGRKNPLTIIKSCK